MEGGWVVGGQRGGRGQGEAGDVVSRFGGRTGVTAVSHPNTVTRCQ